MNSYQNTINKLVKGLTNKTIKNYIHVFEDIQKAIEYKNSKCDPGIGGFSMQVMDHFDDYTLEDKLLFAKVNIIIHNYYSNVLHNCSIYTINYDKWKFSKTIKFDKFYNSLDYKNYSKNLDNKSVYWTKAKNNKHLIKKAY